MQASPGSERTRLISANLFAAEQQREHLLRRLDKAKERAALRQS